MLPTFLASSIVKRSRHASPATQPHPLSLLSLLSYYLACLIAAASPLRSEQLNYCVLNPWALTDDQEWEADATDCKQNDAEERARSRLQDILDTECSAKRCEEVCNNALYRGMVCLPGSDVGLLDTVSSWQTGDDTACGSWPFRHPKWKAVAKTTSPACGCRCSADVEPPDCTWRIQGQIIVDWDSISDFATLNMPPTAPLQGVKLKVSAATTGLYNEWETVLTNANGEFAVTKTKNCNKRKIRVELKFDSDDLQIRHATATTSLWPEAKATWYEIYRDDKEQNATTTIDIGTRALSRDSLQEADAHAEIWALYSAAIDFMKELEAPFKTKVKIKYPHDGIAPDDNENSYANPQTKVIYIVRNSEDDQLDAHTLLHELGHIWSYNYFKGEVCLTTELLRDFDTHGTVEDPCAAYLEGFAEYWSDVLRRRLFGLERVLPLNNERLGSLGLDSVQRREHHDEGWWSFLHLLTTPELYTYVLGVAGGNTLSGRFVETSPTAPSRSQCDESGIRFRDVIELVSADGGISSDDATIGNFLDRFERRSQKVTGELRNVYYQLADPSSPIEPQEWLCR